MADQLAVPLADVEWVIASYIMIICSTLPFFGRLGDIMGKSKVFWFGALVFTVGTFLCGICSSLTSLILCRFLAGLGAAAFMANNQGIVTQLYPQEGRGKALGILAASVALGTMTGSPLGGLIISLLSWNYIFFVNVPVGILLLILGWKYLPRDRTIPGQHIDTTGSLLSFLGTTILFGALIEAQTVSFTDPSIWGALLVSALIIAVFIRFEKNTPQPLLDLRLFANKLFSVSLICALISFICISAYTLIFPFYFEDTLHLSPSVSGCMMMVPPLIIASLAAFCGSLADRIGAEILTIAGLSVMAVSFFLMSFLDIHSSLPVCAVLLALMAVGQALFQPANNSLVMSACPRDKLGIGGSINSWVRNLGQYMGVVLSTTFLFLFMSHDMGQSVSDYILGRDNVFIYGMKNDFLLLMAFCLLGVWITACRYRQMRKRK